MPIGLGDTYSKVFKAVWEAHISLGDSNVRLLYAVCGIWAVVTATLIVQFLWKSWKVSRKAKWYSSNKDSRAEQVLERVKSESRRTPAVKVCICPTLDIPMGIGLFRHYICLPDRKYGKEELYYILKHEYAHFCNRDLTVKFLVHLFCCIFWWNPAVYLLKKDIGQILEIRCDFKATEEFSKREKLQYLFAIVSILEKSDGANRRPPPVLATGLACRKNEDDMRERFRMITAVPRSVPRLCQGAFWALAVTLVVLSYFFVLQPAFDPPVEDVYTDSSVVEIDTTESYITKDHSGNYFMVIQSGERIQINEAIAKVYLSEGMAFKGGE